MALTLLLLILLGFRGSWLKVLKTYPSYLVKPFQFPSHTNPLLSLTIEEIGLCANPSLKERCLNFNVCIWPFVDKRAANMKKMNSSSGLKGFNIWHLETKYSVLLRKQIKVLKKYLQQCLSIQVFNHGFAINAFYLIHF